MATGEGGAVGPDPEADRQLLEVLDSEVYIDLRRLRDSARCARAPTSLSQPVQLWPDYSWDTGTRTLFEAVVWSKFTPTTVGTAPLAL